MFTGRGSASPPTQGGQLVLSMPPALTALQIRRCILCAQPCGEETR